MRLAGNAEVLDFLYASVRGPLRVGAPLGLGKPNALLNDLYRRACLTPAKPLDLFTALSLDPPTPKSFLEKRFYPEFLNRHFGENYPRLEYAQALRAGRLPAHVRVYEFYSQAGYYAHSPLAQQNYISLNYTHAAAAILDRGLEVILQLVARAPDGRYSLSCNPDITLDLVDMARARGKPLLVVGVVHPSLPFLGGDAVVDESFFAAVTDAAPHELFAIPRAPIDDISHAIGFHASQLVADGGTLQIGIGALAEALVHSLVLRQKDNLVYQALAAQLPPPVHCAREVFSEGLYGTSEMVMDGFMHLRRAGILKRKAGRGGCYLDGAFFLGSKNLYAWLRDLEGEDFAGLDMTRVSRVNDLYDPDETSLRRERKKARFFNTAMGVTLLGGVISDTLGNGTVVSGVGGQYNFVAMSKELPDAVSAILLRSTRREKGRLVSNITMHGGHLTIPRHLRDVVVTEYGVADLRGKTDAECIAAMIAVADSAFQDDLARAARRAGKLPASYRVPDSARRNRRQYVREFFKEHAGYFPAYPFGSDFTPAEQNLVGAFARLKAARPWELPGFLLERGSFPEELGRLGLARPKTLREFFYARLVRGALRR